MVGVEDDRHLAAAERRPQEQPPAEPLTHAMLGIADECVQRDRRPVGRFCHDIDVGMAAAVCLHARGAGSAGHQAETRPFAEQRLGKRQGHRAFADTGRADEQISPTDAAMCGSPHELPDHGILSDDLTATCGWLPGHGRSFQAGRAACHSGKRRSIAARRCVCTMAGSPVASTTAMRSGRRAASARYPARRRPR